MNRISDLTRRLWAALLALCLVLALTLPVFAEGESETADTAEKETFHIGTVDDLLQLLFGVVPEGALEFLNRGEAVLKGLLLLEFLHRGQRGEEGCVAAAGTDVYFRFQKAFRHGQGRGLDAQTAGAVGLQLDLCVAADGTETLDIVRHEGLLSFIREGSFVPSGTTYFCQQ